MTVETTSNCLICSRMTAPVRVADPEKICQISLTKVTHTTNDPDLSVYFFSVRKRQRTECVYAEKTIRRKLLPTYSRYTLAVRNLAGY